MGQLVVVLVYYTLTLHYGTRCKITLRVCYSYLNMMLKYISDMIIQTNHFQCHFPVQESLWKVPVHFLSALKSCIL